MDLRTTLKLTAERDPGGFSKLVRELVRLRRLQRDNERSARDTNKAFKAWHRSLGKAKMDIFQIARRSDLAARSATRLRHAFLAIGTGGIVGAALGTFVRKMAQLNDEFQTTQIQLAGTLSRQYGTGTFAQSMPMAEGLQRQLQFRAANTPGTAQELSQAFIQLAPTTGLSTRGVTDLSSDLLWAGQLSRGAEGRRTIIRDIGQSLGTGRISRREQFDLGMLFDQAGMSVDEFNNAQGREAKLDTLTRALDRLAPMIEALNNTFQVQSTTLVSYLELLANSLTGDAASRVTGGLASVNSFFENNFAVIDELAERLAPLFTVIATSGGAALAALAGLGAVLGVIGSLVALFGAGAVGTGILGAVVGAAAAATVLIGAAPTLAVIAGVFASIMLVLSTGGPYVDKLKQSFNSLFTELAFAFESITSSFWSIYEVFKPLMLLIGTIGIASIEDYVDAFARLIRFVADSVKVIEFGILSLATAFKAFRAWQAGNNGLAQDLWQGANAYSGAMDQFALRALDIFRPLRTTEGKEGANVDADGKGVTKNVTEFNGEITVNIQAETIEDPLRVGVVMEQFFSEISRRTRSARRRGVRSNMGGR